MNEPWFKAGLSLEEVDEVLWRFRDFRTIVESLGLAEKIPVCYDYARQTKEFRWAPRCSLIASIAIAVDVEAMVGRFQSDQDGGEGSVARAQTTPDAPDCTRPILSKCFRYHARLGKPPGVRRLLQGYGWVVPRSSAGW